VTPTPSERLTRGEFVTRAAGFSLALTLPRGRFPTSATLDPRLGALERVLRGPVITPADSRYASTRVGFNALYDTVHPLAIAQPLDAADVARVVDWARTTHVPIVARSGGHSYGGYSTTPGVVVDLPRLAAIEVDGALATIGPGARLGNIYDALGAHGRAIPAGTCPTVGIGGHALGGGFGLAARAWGLASDNLAAVQIVTADGETLVADAHQHSDLYWACRGGGGGNFGIVTRLTFRTHPVAGGSYFVATWPWAQAEEVVASFLAWAPHAPDAMGSLCRLSTGPNGPTVQVFGQYLGSVDAMNAALQTLTPPAQQLVTGQATWIDLVRRWAGCLGHTLPACSTPGHQTFVGASDYIDRLPQSAQLALFTHAIEARGTGAGALLIDAYGGAVSRIAPTATAFPHRRSHASIQ
jgi:FAD/FMN-containing dehydrogenase